MAKAAAQSAKPRDNARTVIYAVVGVLVLVAAYLYLSPAPTPPAPRHHAGHAALAPSDESEITAADITAHFPRYKAGKRDPFIPLISPNPIVIGQQPGAQGQWALTGISGINGVPNALLENSTTGETALLTVGQRWRGLQVAAIESDAVLFENSIGQQTRLAFDDTDAAKAAPANLPSAGQVGPLPNIGNLPPMPIPSGAPSGAQPNTTQGSSKSP